MAPDNGRVNRINKLIINPWTGPTECGWFDCWQRAREGYTVRMHEHSANVPCRWVEQSDGSLGRHAFYNFCSAWCRALFLSSTGFHARETAARNRGQIFGMYPEGMKQGRYGGLARPVQRRVKAST